MSKIETPGFMPTDTSGLPTSRIGHEVPGPEHELHLKKATADLKDVLSKAVAEQEPGEGDKDRDPAE